MQILGPFPHREKWTVPPLCQPKLLSLVKKRGGGMGLWEGLHLEKPTTTQIFQIWDGGETVIPKPMEENSHGSNQTVSTVQMVVKLGMEEIHKGRKGDKVGLTSDMTHVNHLSNVTQAIIWVFVFVSMNWKSKQRSIHQNRRFNLYQFDQQFSWSKNKKIMILS